VRKTHARWLRRARPDFTGLAKAVDKDVVTRSKTLVSTLADLRDAAGAKIFGDPVTGQTEKAGGDPVTGDVAALSTAKYEKLKSAIAELEAQAYADAIYDDGARLVEAAYQNVRDLLALEDGFDVVPTWALDELRKHADEIGGVLAENDRKTLTGVLEQALTDGTSGRDTAKALKDAYADGVTSYDENGEAIRTLKPDSWYTMVARTELQRASNLGQFALYEQAGVASVRWQAAEPCNACSEADDVVLPIGDVFPGVDVDMPPAHPACRCCLIPADEDLGSHRGTDADRAAARRGNAPDPGDE